MSSRSETGNRYDAVCTACGSAMYPRWNLTLTLVLVFFLAVAVWGLWTLLG